MKRKLNIKLLRRIQAHITEEPRRFTMGAFEIYGEPGTKNWIRDTCTRACTTDISPVVPPCGTAACIAGWANAMTGAKKGQLDDPSRAAKKLGLPDIDDTAYLFGNPEYYWPNPFGKLYAKARTAKQRAKIACARIDHLIETGK
jgi:hypothetical protein